MLGAQSCLTLYNPMGFSPPGSSVHGILQARILEWVAISFSRGSSQPRDGNCVSYISCIGRREFASWNKFPSEVWLLQSLRNWKRKELFPWHVHLKKLALRILRHSYIIKLIKTKKRWADKRPIWYLARYIFFFKFLKFILGCVGVLGLNWFARTFSSCVERALFFIAELRLIIGELRLLIEEFRLLIAVASLVVEPWLSLCGLQ